VATMRIFEVMSDRFNFHRICNIVIKYKINLNNNNNNNTIRW